MGWLRIEPVSIRKKDSGALRNDRFDRKSAVEFHG